MNRTLDVYLDHSLVGHLGQDQSGQMIFHYDAEWLQHPQAVPLSWSLPLRQAPFTQKECRSFFAGILPEEADREVIARIFGISARNDYAMLEQIGGECAGAVTLLPTGTDLTKSAYEYRSLNETNLAKALRQLPRHPLLAGEPNLRLSLAGVQHKIAVYIDENGRISLPLGNAPSTHILKPAIERFPNLVSNELLCLDLAKSIGIPTVLATTGFANDIEYLLVERYDRIKDDKEKYPIRRHQEDFCQALGIPPERKYQSEGGPSLKDCFTLLREASSLPAIDLQNLLNTVIFNVIVGNHDAHGKNFSLLFDTMDGNTSVRLAPAYDIVSTVYYPELTPKMAMKLGKEYGSSHLVRKNIERFATDAGLGVAAVHKHVVEIAKNVKSKLPEMKNSHEKVADLIALIDARATRILLKMAVKP
ncbi:MAG: type II toxin-antitoxin system HipA family toxin [Gammaproteobacteria bacterium]